MYNKLYLYKGSNFYWTMCSDDTEYCKNYRIREQQRRFNELLKEIDCIECKDDYEAKFLQLTINEVFKPFTDGGGMKITIKLGQFKFIKFCNYIKVNIDNDNKLRDLFIEMTNFKYEKKSGFVYLVKCKNDKLKIGTASDFTSRWLDLQKEERNQAIEVIDTFKTNDVRLAEGALHLYCRKYKTNGNKEVKYLQDVGNSELFENNKYVIESFNKFKEKLCQI